MACSFASYLLVLLVDAHLMTGILILLESVRRHLVKADGGLVGVLDQDVFALIHAKYHVNNGTDDSPSVVKVECHLGGEVAGLGCKDTEDDVVVVVLGVGTGDKTVVMLVESDGTD